MLPSKAYTPPAPWKYSTLSTTARERPLPCLTPGHCSDVIWCAPEALMYSRSMLFSLKNSTVPR